MHDTSALPGVLVLRYRCRETVSSLWARLRGAGGGEGEEGEELEEEGEGEEGDDEEAMMMMAQEGDL